LVREEFETMSLASRRLWATTIREHAATDGDRRIAEDPLFFMAMRVSGG
jgi:hypothetical protein